jgi:hypothetical protein
MSNAEYPYRVDYKRTNDWFDGHWAEVSTWCNETVGAGKWEFYWGEFVFAEEQDYMLFQLKWL